MLELTKHIKQINLPINDKLKSKLIHWDGNPEEIERINQVTVSKQFPILVMLDEKGQIDWILDGNHRLHKAIQSQAETIPAKLIRPSDLNDKAKKIFYIRKQGVEEGWKDVIAGIVDDQVNEKPQDFDDMKLDGNKLQQSLDYFYTDHAPNKIGGRKDVGSLKGLNLVTFTKNLDTLVFLVNKDDQAVFYVAYRPFKDGISVGNVRSNGTVKATEVYAWLVDKFDTLYSDKHQTPQGRKIWDNLAKFYPNLSVSDIGDRLKATNKVAENFADGKVKGKSRPGRVKRAGASCAGSVTDLRAKAKNSSGEKAKMYHWCANMKSGRKKS
jgi:hypothetical protein